MNDAFPSLAKGPSIRVHSKAVVLSSTHRSKASRASPSKPKLADVSDFILLHALAFAPSLTILVKRTDASCSLLGRHRDMCLPRGCLAATGM
jgi:hypothetical protein